VAREPLRVRFPFLAAALFFAMPGYECICWQSSIFCFNPPHSEQRTFGLFFQRRGSRASVGLGCHLIPIFYVSQGVYVDLVLLGAFLEVIDATNKNALAAVTSTDRAAIAVGQRDIIGEVGKKKKER